MSAVREQLARALYAERPQHSAAVGRAVDFNDASPLRRERAYEGADLILPLLTPQSPQVEQLATRLEELLYDRGSRVDNWPADEAALYRELGWAEGRIGARRLMFEKAARALLEKSSL